MAESLINSLQGLSRHTKLGRVFKEVDHLMDSNEEELKANIDIILKHYQSSNDLEKLIRIRLINRYRCYDEVLSLLKSEDLFYISHALHCSWFYENSNFDPQLLVDCVLPHMSYTTRLKVLKKYSKSLTNPEVAVIFFSCLKQRYGLNTAVILLPACDQIFVQNILMTTSIKFHVSVLLSLFHIYPSIVVNYLSHLLENASAKKRIYRKFRFSLYEKVFILIAKKEPQKFAILMEKYHRLIPYMKLGKRSTKQFVKLAFDSIKKNGLVYKRILNWKFVVSCLNLEQISELQFSFLPKTVNDFFQIYSNYCDFVLVASSLKESVSREVLISNFQRAYNKPMTAYLNVMNLDLAHLLPPEIRERWVETKLPTLDNPCEKSRYIVHLPITKSFPLLKKMVELQSDVDVRLQILKCMFKTAIVNNSEELIKDICLYVLARFRNDRYIIRAILISELRSYKHLMELHDDCWEVIEEIINIMILDNKTAGNTECMVVEVLKAHIHSRLKRNLSIDNYLEKLLKISTDYSTLGLCKSTPYEKRCLKWFLDYIPKKKLSKTNKEIGQRIEENTELLETILKRLCEWNAYHLNDRIDFPDWLNDWIATILFDTEECQYYKQSVLELVKKDELLKHAVYRRVFPNYINPNILTYNLHQDPELVLRHAENIINKILSGDPILGHPKPYHSFFKQCRLYPALNLPDIISKQCIKFLTQKYENSQQSEIDARINSIPVLAVTIETTKFVELIKDFCPKKSVMDDYSDEGRELFKLQTVITGCLKYVNTPSEVLETLCKFAVGDYLKLVVGSLSSICLRTPENKILQLLKQWFDCPISLRKHFFRAYFRIAPVFNTTETIVSFFEKEKNMSLRVLLFDHGLRLFYNEPTSETFRVLKTIAGKLNSSDETSRTKLLAVENVPDEFVSEYVQLLWDVINDNIENEVLLKDNRNMIIALIEPDILQLLSEEVCDVLITEVFMQNSVDLKLFVASYLLYSKTLDQLNKRYEKVFAQIEQLLMNWNDFDLKSDIVFKNRKVISFFVDCLVRKSFNLTDETFPSHELLKKVKSNLLNALQEYDILEEVLLIEISVFFLINPDNDDLMQQFLKLIEPLIDRVVSTYGTALIETFGSIIKKTLAWKFSINTDFSLDNYLISLSEILFSSTSNHCFILGLKILPTTINSDLEKYKSLLTVIFQNNDPVVKLYVSELLKKLSSNVKVE